MKGKYSDYAIGGVPSLSVVQLSTVTEVGHNAFLEYSKSRRLHQRAEIPAEGSHSLQERNEDFANVIAREVASLKR